MESAVTIKLTFGSQFLRSLVRRILKPLGQHTRTLSFSRFINLKLMEYASMLPSVIVLEWGVWS